jgi:two-component system, chemotaxis family, protein-glutamate methylesterase/glutaminase
VRQGVIYLAPADHHLLLEKDRLTVQRGPREHSTRPAVDPLFRSAAAAYGDRVVGVLLTGGGQDGVSGLIAISRAQGLCLAQDPQEAWMPSMPMNAIRFDEVAGALSLDDLPAVLQALVRGETGTCGPAPERQQT